MANASERKRKNSVVPHDELEGTLLAGRRASGTTRLRVCAIDSGLAVLTALLSCRQKSYNQERSAIERGS
jgi:hypothetical protein